MPGTNQFLPYATDPAAPVLDNASWAAAVPALGRGPGIVPKEYFNKANRQGNVMASAVGAFIAAMNFNALDDGNVPNLTAALTSALNALIGGSAPSPIKAWVNFDGSTTVPAIRSGLNVSSVTRNAVSDYTLHFATALADANYAVSGICCASTSTQLEVNIHANGGPSIGGPASLMTTTALRIAIIGSGGTVNSSVICITIVR